MNAEFDSIASRLPEGACDTHVHVFDPVAFPYAAARNYTPPPASLEALCAMHAALGVARVVLVQPSIYGTDNDCLLAALRTLGPGRARGVAVIDPIRTDAAEFERLHAAGVRGIRLNLAVRGDTGLDAVRGELAAARCLAGLPGLSLQIHARLAVLASLADELADLGVPVVLDHFAGASGADGADCAALDAICALMASGVAYVKLSAPYRVTRDEPARRDVAALARRFCDAAPERVVWGSDWPHTGGGSGGRRDAAAIEPFRAEDNARALGQLRDWLEDDQALARILIDNPAKLYGFGDSPT